MCRSICWLVGILGELSYICLRKNVIQVLVCMGSVALACRSMYIFGRLEFICPCIYASCAFLKACTTASLLICMVVIMSVPHVVYAST